MSYPIQWLDKVFNSRAKTETLLRPDLESGLITEHDYHLATTFLPGPQRYYHIAYSVVATLGTVVYGRVSRRPPWSPQRTALFGILSCGVGGLLGTFRRVVVHFKFAQSLDDPNAFAQALQNVNIRLGGVRPLQWTLPQLKGVPKPTIGQTDIHGDTARPAESESVWAPDNTGSTGAFPETSEATPRSTQPPPPSAPSPQTASRWDAIRRENASAKPSSWDSIRQRHERAAVQDKVFQPVADAAGITQTDATRSEEQARFDALLEAERRIGGR